MALIDEIKQILGDVLQLGQKGDVMSETTLLLGSMPEFDSMAVVSVITAIEENYGFAVDDDEIDAEVFESVGSLTRFVERKLG
ncbi:MAG: phosphopantetheine-binding protein [Pseudomonadota bacterium]|nr:phosphopantetheine-binding protein [Pseudomonadota bacterium]